MIDSSSVLISVHKGFADAIFSGSKTVELRRRFSNLPAGTRIWIYVTKPTGVIAGFVELVETKTDSPETIWKNWGAATGISRSAFLAYFSGAEKAVALRVAGARRTKKISLEAIQKIRKGFHPPQIVTRLTYDEAAALERIAGVVRR